MSTVTSEETPKTIDSTTPEAPKTPPQTTSLGAETIIPTTPPETPANEIGQDTIAQIRQSISDIPAPETIAETNPNPNIKHEIDPIPPAAVVNQVEPVSSTGTKRNFFSLVRNLFSKKPKSPAIPANPENNPIQTETASIETSDPAEQKAA